MVQDFTRKLRKGNNLWWIAAFALVGFCLCVGAAMLIRYVFPAVPTALPNVPVYVYNSPTPVAPDVALPAATVPPNVIYITATPAPASPTPLPTATATTFSVWNWIYPKTTVPTSVYIPPTQPPPIQVVVITSTPAASPFPSPPPQPTLSPKTCKNILYPARPGSQWTYYVNTPRRSGNVTMSVTGIDARQATVDAIEQTTGATVRTAVLCDQDIILDFPLLSGQKILGDLVNGTMTVDYVGGVLAPNEAAFTSSNWALSWIIQYRVYGNGRLQYNGREFNAVLSPSNVQMTCQTLGAGTTSFETVTVAAGTFNALKVICRGEGVANGTVNGTQVSGTITAQSTQWFAPNIGLVKLQSDYAYLNVFGISIPLSQSDVAGYLELLSYKIGQ